jgi:hypothetical protein
MSVVPESSDHLDFLVFSKEVFEVLDKDFNDLGLVVGYFLLSYGKGTISIRYFLLPYFL